MARRSLDVIPQIPWDVIGGLEDLIGRGGFCLVYKAKVVGMELEREGHLDVAVKVHNENVERMFLREIEVGFRLEHPAIVRFLSFSVENRSIAMERCFGDLNKVIERHKDGGIFRHERGDGSVVEWNDTKRCMGIFGIAAGMCYLHEHNIIHRDLTLSNILVDEDLCVKIGGFAYARILPTGSEGADSSRPMTPNVGSPLYIAPEVLEGDGYTTAIDVYSFGIIVYQLVLYSDLSWPWSNGRQPRSMSDLMNSVHNGVRPVIPDSVSAEFRQLMNDCWAQDPGLRPTFREILERLEDPVFVFPDTDVEEYELYRRRMLAML
jgi:serine/threonine protein kinase